MKIHVSCIKCTKEQHEATGIKTVQINDENVYAYTCPFGHVNSIILQHQKFELLFESAVYAIHDGYYREAISSVASCVERVHEFAINVISKKYNLNEEIRNLGWNQLKKQSERQLGAFIYLYLIEFKKMPPLLKTKSIEFRNDIVHKGYFPNYSETINFAQEALDNIFEIIKNLHDYCKTEVELVIADNSRKKADLGREFGLPLISSLHPTIINLSVYDDPFDSRSIENHIERIISKQLR